MSDPTTTPTPTEPQDVREQHQIVSVGRGDLPGGVYVKCRCDEHVLIPAAAYTDHVLAAVSAAAPDEREALAAAMHAEVCCPCDPTGCDVSDVPEMRYADAALAWFTTRPAPTVNAADVEITTAAELDALPAGTIVRDRFGGYLAQGRDAMGVAWFHYPDYDHAGSSALVAGIGPVTVCFTPGLTVADEGAER